MTKSSEAASDRQQNGLPEDMKNIQLVEDKFEIFCANLQLPPHPRRFRESAA